MEILFNENERFAGMRKLSLLIVCLFFWGCAPAANRIPDGKTETDWEFDRKCCLVKSGRVEGFLFTDPVNLFLNIERNKKYRECLAELGWIE